MPTVAEGCGRNLASSVLHRGLLTLGGRTVGAILIDGGVRGAARLCRANARDTMVKSIAPGLSWVHSQASDAAPVHLPAVFHSQPDGAAGERMQLGIAGRRRTKRECGFGTRASGARVTGHRGSTLFGSRAFEIDRRSGREDLARVKRWN